MLRISLASLSKLPFEKVCRRERCTYIHLARWELLNTRWSPGRVLQHLYPSIQSMSIESFHTAKLSEVEIRTSMVTDIHGLPEALLGVVSVKDHRVKQDRDTLENNFNEAAHQGLRLE
jgi:hypothetical protein